MTAWDFLMVNALVYTGNANSEGAYMVPGSYVSQVSEVALASYH